MLTVLPCFSRILTTLMTSMSSLASPQLCDAFIAKIDPLLDNTEHSHHNNPRRVLQFLRSIRYPYRPLLEKCNKLFMQNIQNLDIGNLSIIIGLYHSLQFNNLESKLAMKQRLIDMIDTCTDPVSFAKLFVTLAPIVSQEIREGFVSVFWDMIHLQILRH